MRVDDDAAGHQPLGDAFGTSEVGSKHIGLQSVVAIIGDFDGLIFVLIGEKTQDGTKDFFAGDAHFSS